MITIVPVLVIALILISYQLDRPKEAVLYIGSTKKLGWRIGWISRILDSFHGSCDRCHTTWGFVDGHDVRYSLGRGCFVLCKSCYYAASLEERIRYYHQWLDNYYINDPNYFQMSDTLLNNLKAEATALKPGTKVLFEQAPYQWVLETPIGSSPDGWVGTPTKGTIARFYGLEPNGPNKSLVPVYAISLNYNDGRQSSCFFHTNRILRVLR